MMEIQDNTRSTLVNRSDRLNLNCLFNTYIHILQTRTIYMKIVKLKINVNIYN